jgi:4-amino-4-deoxy-L-arabinose transferase-like glycosyltransferase
MTTAGPRSNPWRYLILAGIIHVALTITIMIAGHFQFLPGTFDEKGNGLTFALDGRTYGSVATGLVEEWQTKGLTAWVDARAPFHSRLLSLVFATLGRIVGHNILAAEPLNLFYYLGILTCSYFLGREIFNHRAGLLAASIVALWPSFLLHSTQLMRDSLAILCFLVLMLFLTLLLTRELTWLRGVLFGVAGAVVVTLFWVTRGNMWNAVLVALAIAMALLLQRMIRQQKFLAGNAVVLLFMVTTALLAPSRLQSSTLPGSRLPATPFAVPSATQPAPPEGIWARAIKQISDRRSGFRFFTSQTSNIDEDVKLDGLGDIVRFIPRATVIGFFAPFPRMWVETGKFGLAGRLLSGLETLVMYFLYLAVADCLWEERRNPTMWFLFLVATAGIVALGIVVVNAGALYRIRYVFWMMLIVIAAQRIQRLASAYTHKSARSADGFT